MTQEHNLCPCILLFIATERWRQVYSLRSYAFFMHHQSTQCLLSSFMHASRAPQYVSSMLHLNKPWSRIFWTVCTLPPLVTMLTSFQTKTSQAEPFQQKKLSTCHFGFETSNCFQLVRASGMWTFNKFHYLAKLVQCDKLLRKAVRTYSTCWRVERGGYVQSRKIRGRWNVCGICKR